MNEAFLSFTEPKQFEVWAEDALLFVFHVNNPFEVKTMAFLTERNAAPYGHYFHIRDTVSRPESAPGWRTDEKWVHIIKRLIIVSNEKLADETSLNSALEKYLSGIRS